MQPRAFGQPIILWVGNQSTFFESATVAAREAVGPSNAMRSRLIGQPGTIKENGPGALARVAGCDSEKPQAARAMLTGLPR
jgi:hypothetical protein